MAWVAPMTAVAGTIFTAAQWNMFIRDNLNETCPAKATTSGRYFVSRGPNSLAERGSSQSVETAAETTTETSYTDLATAGPQVSLTTGNFAIVFMRARVSNTSAATCRVNFAISGATDVEPVEARAAFMRLAVANQSSDVTATSRVGLTAGSNTFTMRYRVSAGTGTFSDRRLLIFAL